MKLPKQLTFVFPSGRSYRIDVHDHFFTFIKEFEEKYKLNMLFYSLQRKSNGEEVNDENWKQIITETPGSQKNEILVEKITPSYYALYKHLKDISNKIGKSSTNLSDSQQSSTILKQSSMKTNIIKGNTEKSEFSEFYSGGTNQNKESTAKSVNCHYPVTQETKVNLSNDTKGKWQRGSRSKPKNKNESISVRTDNKNDRPTVVQNNSYGNENIHSNWSYNISKENPVVMQEKEKSYLRQSRQNDWNSQAENYENKQHDSKDNQNKNSINQFGFDEKYYGKAVYNCDKTVVNANFGNAKINDVVESSRKKSENQEILLKKATKTIDQHCSPYEKEMKTEQKICKVCGIILLSIAFADLLSSDDFLCASCVISHNKPFIR